MNFALGLVIRVNELPEKSVPNFIYFSVKLAPETISLTLTQKLGSLSLLLVKGMLIFSLTTVYVCMYVFFLTLLPK